MLKRSRRYRALSRTLAVLLLITGWAAPLAFPHSWDDDAICVVRQVTGSSDASRISGVLTSGAQPGHCVVCHTARSFRSPPAASGRFAVVISSGQILDTPADSFRHGPSIVRLPARAPPA